jgi:hypothetical protein
MNRGAHRTHFHLQLAAMGVGAIIGAGSFLAHNRWPGTWAAIGEMGAFWLVGSFTIGQRATGIGSASLGGLICIEVAIAAYYVAQSSIIATAAPFTTQITWAAIGGLAGPMLGVAGFYGASPSRRLCWIGGLILAIAFIIEGLMNFRAHMPHASVDLTIEGSLGLLLPPLLIGIGRVWSAPARHRVTKREPLRTGSTRVHSVEQPNRGVRRQQAIGAAGIELCSTHCVPVRGRSRNHGAHLANRRRGAPHGSSGSTSAQKPFLHRCFIIDGELPMVRKTTTQLRRTNDPSR